MLDQTSSVSSNAGTSASASPPSSDTVANQVLEANRTPQGFDMGGLKRDLDRARFQDPANANALTAAVERQLTPVQRGELASASYSVEAPDGAAVSFSSNGQRVSELRAAPENTPARQLYDRLDRAFGDGNGLTDDTATIETGLQRMIAGGQTLEQVEAQAAAAQPAATPQGPDPVQLGLDLTQMALDIGGIVDPSGIADGSNAVISAGRAIGSLFSGDFGGAGGHAVNGLISAAGVVPLAGDLAKLGKIGKWAQTVTDAVSAVAHNPALRSALEPGLRAVSEAVNRIPQGALDALPASARESIERMKTQLDEFFGGGARVADNAAGAIVDTANVGRKVTINGREVTIGAAPEVARRADGRPLATNANGDQVALRQPGTTGTTRVDNPDGTVTYTRNGESVKYDANGFPLFQSTRADVYLPPDKIVVGSRETHFTAANRMLAERTDDQLRGAGFSNADIANIRAGNTPDGYTWHHHQDVGRMQLVRTSEHEALSGGHTGGWSLWGDGARFTVE